MVRTLIWWAVLYGTLCFVAGRGYIGIERDPRYHAAAEAALAAAGAG